MKIAAVLLAISCSGNGGPGEPGIINPNGELALQPIVTTGLSSPVHLASPPDDDRLFVVEQPGRVRIIQNGTLLQTPFLNIASKVRSGGEEGLLSIAFHPSYAGNRHFYVYYTNLNGDIQVDRYTASASSPNIADPASAMPIITVPHPVNSNHNGGQLAFGPDGFLYIGTGDGGAGGDPPNNAQNLNVLLGKILRIDVNPANATYTIPANNPFRTQANARPEIWAYGLRNPWRFSFDRVGNMLYIGDVGQNRREEINAEPRVQAGVNYGWKIMEGTLCFLPMTSCDRAGLTLPIHDYARDDGNCSVTGGFVYRGSAIPQIAGLYFFTDYCKSDLRSLRLSNGAATDVRVWNTAIGSSITSFGEDRHGELYVISHAGSVGKLVRAP